MNYSFEELYFMYGQYDRFVRIHFSYTSQSYNIYGDYIMGVFMYTLEERNMLEELFKTNVTQRTDRKIRFNPTDLDNILDSTQLIDLDKEGFLCSDIAQIYSVNLGQTNRFAFLSQKEIPNLMTINFNSAGFNINNALVHLYSSRMEKGPKLCPDELDEYFGTVLYHIEKKNGEIPDLFIGNNGQIRDNILFYKYEAIFRGRESTLAEDEDYYRIGLDRIRDRMEVIKKELIKGGTSFEKIVKSNPSYINLFTSICVDFKGETLLLSSFPVWWDFEKYIHIFFRHVNIFKVNNIFADKTNFQYSVKFVKQIISIVLGILKDDIEKHFTKTPEKSFRRNGSRSTYYDGIYYQIEVEPTGRLIWFHPRN